MTEREKLIKLIETGTRIAYDRSLEEVKRIVKENHHFNSATDRTVSISEMVADFLLENGVIVPPVKVGERRIDDLGRIHIPKDVRLSLGINYGDVISISVSDASIILRKESEQK